MTVIQYFFAQPSGPLFTATDRPTGHCPNARMASPPLGHSDFAPVDLAYYQHFLGVLFENIAFWEVLRGNHKCRSRGATLLVNVKLECVQLRKHIASRSPNDIAPVILGFSFFCFANIVSLCTSA